MGGVGGCCFLKRGGGGFIALRTNTNSNTYQVSDE